MLLKPHNGPGPEVAREAYISDGAMIIGDVTIGKTVFVAPAAVIRADEENSSIHIEDGCNVQDGVIVHALRGSEVKVERDTSLSHGCIVHGPCSIGKDSFIGFRATVFGAKIGKCCMVMHGATVLNVTIPPGKLVPVGMVLDSQKEADELGDVPRDLKEFKRSVRDTNVELVKRYSDRL